MNRKFICRYQNRSWNEWLSAFCWESKLLKPMRIGKELRKSQTRKPESLSISRVSQSLAPLLFMT